MSSWCTTNNLILNSIITKEIVVDFRQSKRTDEGSVDINGGAVDRVIRKI